MRKIRSKMFSIFPMIRIRLPEEIILTLNLENMPKIDLCLLPTPIIPLNRLSKYLGGPKLYMKRDDLTGIAFGGNKNRKLEYLLADALQQGADVIITEGAINSNHCLQTAACAAKLGIACELVLSGNKPTDVTGNYLLFHVLDVSIHLVSDSEDRKDQMKVRERELLNQGKKPYLIPTGGSTAIGAFGYINCISEIARQAQQMNINFDYFVHATGSSGTHAGVLIGKELFYPELQVISISSGESGDYLRDETEAIIRDFQSRFEQRLDISQESIEVITGYSGLGYGIASKEMVETVKLVAQLEGVFLDPVYNGKAMVGMIDLIKSKRIADTDKVLFLHSGGGPSIFNYAEDFRL
jgi:D-cysteine desulfhydrase family pyridoxal phosphate-dependent enzyme